MSEAYRKGFEDYLTGSPYDESYEWGSFSSLEYEHGWRDGQDQKLKNNRAKPEEISTSSITLKDLLRRENNVEEKFESYYTESYHQGYQAHENGLVMTSNPYDKSENISDWTSWCDGWWNAYTDKNDDGGPDIHNQGCEAFEAGKNWNGCPYDEATPEARTWLGGWLGAYEAYKRRENQ